ncbi:4-hydroxy-tetrahydrodipicolinate synthase [Janibacter alkaliphilus]|uniref:4-hydroxy-tetrahydrodipicolinate synthase n=1 Tax=Janibacter alkaliphilus TaxID=1069963 RepID=A0A852XCT2_9MICO|nr:4-hydroxy-tetrahydrodipicolinate synthase [Janibacter alkaliphilus]NYG38523.1 4-hydroxy-tetrahydrodipicolinate synthase [Janibacter alkaliphilus]
MPDTTPFGRVATAMVTPMTPDGAVDEGGVRAVARHLVETGHDGIVVNGTTGESATLTEDESIEAVRLVVDEVGDQVAVVAGVGSNDTRHSVEMARRSADVGARSLLLVTPYYNKPTQAGVIAHCTAVADATDLPVMLYDIPGRTAIPFTTETLVALDAHPRIQAVKDAKGDLAATSEVLARTDHLIYSGEDALTLPLLAIGAVGMVSVTGHVAGREHVELLAATERGDLATARQIHTRLLPLVQAMMTTSQGAIMAKAALVELGVIDHATVRLPLVEGPPEHLEILRKGMAASGLAVTA